ncbi:MAG: flavodoxin protein [Anaerocolumna sp.]|jgi:flavodoxin|nr:flavodoxin protein [Anaerocolumna sp.]
MKIEVRYYSKTGNTKKLAEAIAKEVGVKAKTVNEPITEETDILFIGSAVYAAGVDNEVKNFISTLDGKVKQVIAFSTAALLPSTYAQIKKLISARGIKISEKEFHCRGEFKFMHVGRPNIDDINKAKEFARSCIL